jgi:DNA polymerase V
VATEKLLTSIQDTRDIITSATTALERIWKDGHRYAKAGVMLNDFTSSGVSQLQLFDERPPRPHSAELMKVLDGINHYGLGLGRGIAPAWQMKRDMLSPVYTTRWKDITRERIS